MRRDIKANNVEDYSLVREKNKYGNANNVDFLMVMLIIRYVFEGGPLLCLLGVHDWEAEWRGLLVFPSMNIIFYVCSFLVYKKSRRRRGGDSTRAQPITAIPSLNHF